jgi:hypothetical protein
MLHSSLLTLLSHDAGIKTGSINSLDAASRGKLSHSEMMKHAELSIALVPDKAVQFV